MQRRVEVVLRVRPVLAVKGSPCVQLDPARACVTVAEGDYPHAPTRTFSQDHLFGATTTNKDIFDQLVLTKMSEATPENPDTLCFLAYGHTSSGKTHSITGSDTEPGILTYCVEELLRREGVVEISMLEVYMDNVQDLLAEGAPRRVRRRRTPQGEAAVVVEGLSTCTLTSVDQWLAVSKYGMRSRRTAPTAHNARSSRSHAIFSVRSNGVRLCLVDLAGSERQTVFSPQLNQESISINKSLSRLSTVLEALSKQKTRDDGTKTFVNFRDTTLTVLLQRYLSGASMTTFLACVHPSSEYYQETISTLRYIQRLKKIRTSLTTPGADAFDFIRPPAETAALLQELMSLRQQVQDSEAASKRLEQQQERIEELEAYLKAHRQRTRRGPGSNPTSAMADRTSRVRDTRRVAGWLLTRVLGDLPRLNVGYDEYFDDLFPSTVQVIGYVSTMACLPPRSPEARLAFLDVGDLAMGLSMVDAGIPPLVRLHRGACTVESEWEAADLDGTGHSVYVLAFFAVNAETVDTLAATNTVPSDTEETPLPCCGGYVSAQPLLPLATVLVVPESSSDDEKERVLQRLVSLQAEQEAVMARRTGIVSRSSGDGGHSDDGTHRLLELEGSTALEASGVEFPRDPTKANDKEAEPRSSSNTSTLAKELVKQAQGAAPLAAPFAATNDDEDTADNNYASQTVNIDALSETMLGSTLPRKNRMSRQVVQPEEVIVQVQVPSASSPAAAPATSQITATPAPTQPSGPRGKAEAQRGQVDYAEPTRAPPQRGSGKPLPEPNESNKSKSKKNKGKDKSTSQGCQCVAL